MPCRLPLGPKALEPGRARRLAEFVRVQSRTVATILLLPFRKGRWAARQGDSLTLMTELQICREDPICNEVL